MSTQPVSSPRLGALAQTYARIRATTQELCRPLSPEDHVVQSMSDASPAKWHLAHTSWFFETFVLLAHQPRYRVFDERFALLFNSYYHAAGERHPRPERGLLSRPTVAEVQAYRRHVDEAMAELLDSRDDSRLTFLVELGLNHEEQHQELLLTDLKHLFAQNPLEPSYRTGRPAPTAPRPEAAPRAGWARYAGGLLEIGAEPSAFAFDNELPRHKRWCEPFELARAPVSAGEYLEFIADGGYRRSELWLSDGWDAVQRLGWEAPLYWRRSADGWRLFTLDGPRALAPAEPVCHVSHYEADAYARWKGARLPREEEWEHAAAQEAAQSGPAGNLLESARLHPAPCAQPGHALDQLFGDVWEWTASPYTPYPGFAPFQGALGEYNGKWMSNRLVLRGGSCVTPARHLRVSYRNFFGPEARWQFSGLRLARSIA